MTRLAGSWVLILVLAGCDPGGFGSSPDGGAGSGTGGEDEYPFVFPSTAHTGFDGVHEFRVPVSTNLDQAAWQIENPAMATIQAVATPEGLAEFSSTWAMVTTTGAGTTKVIATSGGQRIESMILAVAYDPAAVEAGASRYNSPENASAPGRQACASCHAQAGGVDHSPLAMALNTDEEIFAAITEGAYPGGVPLLVPHSWNLTEAERAGIVPYLRSLEPRGF